MLVWVTGNSGAGKSTACAALRARGRTAVDVDWDGYNRWIHRVSGEVVTDPPYPAPPGWLDRYGWDMDRAKVEALVAGSRGTVAFLAGSVENEADVEELAAALRDNPRTEAVYRSRGATIIDATLPPSEVADLILAGVTP